MQKVDVGTLVKFLEAYYRLNLLQQIMNLDVWAFGLPGSERRVAEPAAQIAAGRAHEDGGSPGELPLPLNRRIHFCDAHDER